LNDIEPDIILLTGDYVRWKGDYEPALDFLSRLKAKIGIWGVLGDYEYSNSRKSCVFCHSPGKADKTTRHQVSFLGNEIKALSIHGKKIYIAGLSEVENGFLDGVVGEVNTVLRDKATLVLSHSPLGFDLLEDDTGALMLAGDTHGGQLALPSWVWRLAGYEKNAKYNYGLYQTNKKQMFVSRGTGTSHLPVRYFADPEIVLFHFVDE
jgi:hypothetical protein